MGVEKLSRSLVGDLRKVLGMLCCVNGGGDEKSWTQDADVEVLAP